jgi:hypothetical protein
MDSSIKNAEGQFALVFEVKDEDEAAYPEEEGVDDSFRSMPGDEGQGRMSLIHEDEEDSREEQELRLGDLSGFSA